MAMTLSFSTLQPSVTYLSLALICFCCNFLTSDAIYFQKSRFDPAAPGILYLGDAIPSFGAVELTDTDYQSRVGWVISSEKVPIWDYSSGNLTDFTCRYTFSIDTRNQSIYGHGLVFFLAPVGFQIPPNSVGGFLGLFNTTTSDSSSNQIVSVEFDSFPNGWDPPYEHVGINNNSIRSAVSTPWNASFHSDDTAEAQISYNGTTKTLKVSWTYESTSNPLEKTSLTCQIDLRKFLPELAMVGFSASTGQYGEKHNLYSWEFSSSLDLTDRNGENARNLKLIVSLTVPFGVLLAIGIVAFGTICYKRIKEKDRAVAMRALSMNDDLEREAGPRRFSSKDLAIATNNFSKQRKLGEGGFGSVYKGYLHDLDREVAVKRISENSKQGKKEYITEVKIISRLRHRNLVQLIGWCHENGEFLLVYDYMPNGSLNSHLFSEKNSLTWSMRYRIASGIASGLLYLHEEWEQCVVHRDIKSSNIMLDSSFNVKVGDFGLARLMDHELRLQTTGPAGTIGYMAPEYIRTGRASKESDVYSFGVVALEIATGRRAVNMRVENYLTSLVEWVWDLYGNNELLTAVDKKLKNEYEGRELECLMIVGLWCAHPDHHLRPSIRQAIRVLNFEAALPSLPNKMPVPMYQVPDLPMPVASSSERSLTCSSIDIGR